MAFSALPKIELHLHLDCSLSYRLVRRLRPGISEAAWRDAFVAPPKCTDLMDFLTRAGAGVAVLQTEAALRWAVLDLFEQLAADGVIYAEIRFGPLLHLEQGLTAERVVEIVNAAVGEGIAQTGVQAGLILCTLRHFSEAQSLETVRLVEQFRDTCVVGFDIAGDEAGFPVDAHTAAFEYAHTRGIPCTAHAGEASGPESVWATLRHFRPSRIGHGVRSIEDPALIEFLKENNIHLEVCPTSNIQTNVYGTLAEHPVDRLLQAGVSVGINTDARTVSPVTLNGEYEALQQAFGWETEQLLRCNLQAAEHAFAPEALKIDLRKRLLEGFKQM